jgi:hypothetical protein
VKTYGHHIKTALSLLLLVIYLFVVSAYVVFRPRYNPAGVKITAFYMHNDSGSNNAYTQLHGAFKTLIENKRKAVSFLVEAALPGFVLIFRTVTLLSVSKVPAFDSDLSYIRQYCYLTLRSLRI